MSFFTCSSSIHIYFHFPPAPCPTLNELRELKNWKGFGNRSIAQSIAFHPSTDCDTFAYFLLDDYLVVDGIRKDIKDDRAFVNEVLRLWHSGNGSAVPCTWMNLITCMKNAGLNRRMVETIVANVCRLFLPCSYIYICHPPFPPLTSFLLYSHRCGRATLPRE